MEDPSLTKSLVKNDYHAVVITREEIISEGMTREQYYAPRNGGSSSSCKNCTLVSHQEFILAPKPQRPRIMPVFRSMAGLQVIVALALGFLVGAYVKLH